MGGQQDAKARFVNARVESRVDSKRNVLVDTIDNKMLRSHGQERHFQTRLF